MTELFMKLLNMSINAGWLVLTVLLVRIIFRKAPKWLFPVLWSFVGIRLLMPNALESRLSVIPDISGFSASEQGLLSAKGFTAPVPYVGIVWCTGMAAMLLFEALSYIHLRSKVKTAVRLSANVYQSEHVNAPFILGLFAPRIYIPFHIKSKELMNDFAPTHDLHGLNAMYLYQNATQSAAFSRFSDKEGNWNGLSVSDVFGNEEIKIGYVDGWLSTSKNMVRVFIVLALAVIIMLAPIFSGEYEGVDNIILTSKYGKTKCATAKVAAGILTAILTTALVAAFSLLLALIFYGTEGLDCSILFAPSDYVEGFIPFNITCGTLLKYQILLAFTCTLSVTGITLLISAISKNQIVAFVASMAIFLFPVLLPITEANPLFRLIGLLPLYHVQAVSLLSVEQMNNGMLYAVWAIPTALVFLGIDAVISRRVFAKHQVS